MLNRFVLAFYGLAVLWAAFWLWAYGGLDGISGNLGFYLIGLTPILLLALIRFVTAGRL